MSKKKYKTAPKLSQWGKFQPIPRMNFSPEYPQDYREIERDQEAYENIKEEAEARKALLQDRLQSSDVEGS